MKKYFFLLIVGLFPSGCNLSQMMEKINRIQSIILENCECDGVELINYEENMRTFARYEINGVEIGKERSIAEKINKALQNQIDDYCEIDKFTLDFVNGEHNETIIIRYCKID